MKMGTLEVQPPHNYQMRRNYKPGYRFNSLLTVPEHRIYQQPRHDSSIAYSAVNNGGTFPLSHRNPGHVIAAGSTNVTSGLNFFNNIEQSGRCCVGPDVNRNNGIAVDPSATDSFISQGSPGLPSGEMYRRHTLGALQYNHDPGLVFGGDCANSYGYIASRQNLHDGAISQEEAERKRFLFLHYLEQRFPHQASAILQMTPSENSPLALIRNRASYVADSSHHTPASHLYSYYESESPKYGSLSRGGRLRSSLPIVRTRSRSRERPLGVVYLEYSGESRVAVLPNELTSLDTIRALFVQAYPGLLTMPMLSPQRHTLLLKNKKSQNFDEISNISHIKDRSTIRARPTGIPMPGSKKPPIHQKPKMTSNKKNNSSPKGHNVNDSGVAENNQRNVQKSGLKPPIKPGVRPPHNNSNVSKPSAANNAINTSNHCPPIAKKPLKNKAPPPPPRKPKPSNISGPQNNPVAVLPNAAATNGSSRSGNGLGGGSFPHKGFSYVPTSLDELAADDESGEKIDIKQDNSMTFNAPVDTNKGASNLSAVSVETTRGSRDDDSPQPRTYAGSPMASQTQFSSSSSLQSDQSITKLLKNKGLDNRSKSAGQLPKPTNSNDLTQAALSPTKRGASDSGALQPSLFERKELVQTSDSPLLFPRATRSFRGNQPKPFSIPVVPDLASSCAASQSSSSSSDVSRASRSTTDSSPMTSPATSSCSAEISTSSKKPPIKTRDKNVNHNNNNNNNKKSLFGLKKLALNKPASNTAAQQAVVSEKHLPEPRASSRDGMNGIRIASPASCHSSSSSIASNQAPKLPVKSGSQGHTTGRKAALPKSDLLHSLLSHKADKKNKDVANGKDNCSVSPSNSDVDFQGLSNAPVPTGVLKNGNLVKSASSSSLLTDSGASNLSATPSIKTKKVSFQDNVTVCDVNGISTFSNSLRHPDVDDDAYAGGKSVDGQSLSHDETDSGRYVNSNDSQSKPWRDASIDYNTTSNFNHTRIQQQMEIDPRYSTNYTQHVTSNGFYPGSDYTAHAPHQSAVAAAIQSIGAAPNRSAMIHAHLKPSFAGYDQFAVSCASPVPFVTRQERSAPSYKEEWDPYRQRSHSDVDPSLRNDQHTNARSCVTPSFQNVAVASSKMESAVDVEPSYFQTQNLSVPIKNPQDFDATPYYECCTSSTEQQNNSKPLNDDKRALPSRETTKHSQTPQGAAPEASKSKSSKRDENNRGPTGGNRMMAMERQIASLTGMVETMMTANDSAVATSSGESFQRSGQVDGLNESLSQSLKKQLDMRQQLLNLRATAEALKEDLKELKKQQRSNVEQMNDLVNENSKNVARLVSATAGAQHRPLRLRRMRLDQERHDYGMTASLTEKQLSDVEAAVEELRNEVVERRCRVNGREVEALVLQLSEAGRTVAHLKGTFPTLCDELRTVAAAETEVIYAEEKFTSAEPARLDEQLKRCKQLTATLFTLKKLANVQEARNKTPTSSGQIRPTTPSPLGVAGSLGDPHLNRNNLLQDVARVRVDHRRRMESIQEAEVSWKRRRKFILEHDSKKLEKALEMAEKALNRTDYISKINQRQQAQLKEIYKNKDAHEDSNLTTSDSSSIESLPPAPAPTEHISQHHPSKVPLPSGHTYAVPTSAMRLPPSDFKLHKLPGKAGSGPTPSDLGYLGPEHPANHGRIFLPPENTGSLPRYANSSVYRLGYGGNPHYNKAHPNPEAFHSRGKMMERSRSVTPQHWVPGGLEAAHFQGDFQPAHVSSNDERHRSTEQHQLAHLEKSKKLKEQYSKLQLMQKRQRLSMKKSAASQNKFYPPGVYQHPSPVMPGAKSSDV